MGKDVPETMMIKRTDKVLLIYTGGTIGMVRNPLTGALEPFDFNHLISRIPEFQHIQTDIEVYQFTPPIDSSDMSPKLWAQLVRIISDNYGKYDGFIILHGTDTMAYTASALSFMLENLTKPVILTGSQLPIGQLRTDGRENLITSIELAVTHNQDGTPIVPEVCVYFNGKLLRGNRTIKQNADSLNAFESFNYPHLCDVGVNFTFHRHDILCPDYSRPMIPHTAMDSNVVVFSIFPGIQENVMHHILDVPGLRSIVIRSFGSGNAPHNDWMVKSITEATSRGIVVVNISQCLSGCVEMNRYDTGYQLKNAGVIGGYDCTVEATVTKLMYLQGLYGDHRKIRHSMSHPIVGEMSINKRIG